MNEEQTAQTWRELLNSFIENTAEREQIAHAIHVKPITLMRWASGESQPRENNMRALQRAIPRQYIPLFTKLVAQEYPDGIISDPLPQEDIFPQLPSEFYARILSGYADTPPSLYPHSLYHLVLQQILEHFDPNRQGMAVSIVRCVTPQPHQKVRSLRELVGMGTPPWPRDLLLHPILLGAESLAGAAVSQSRLISIASHDESFLTPSHWTEYEQSAIAYPIKCQTKVIGCLLIASTLQRFFTERHFVLIEHYANLIAPFFKPDDFFAEEDIQLQFMPTYEQQHPYFHNFSERVKTAMLEAAANKTPITIQQAQEYLWQSIEAELLQAVLQTEESLK